MIKKKYILLLFLIVLFACEKNNEPFHNELKATTENEHINSTLINYSVIVTTAEKSSLNKSTKGTNHAQVLVINKNSDTLSVSTNESGIATFKELYPGLVTVVIEKENYSKVELTVELTVTETEGTEVLYASTIVALLHIAGENNICTIKGNAFAQLDVTIKHEPWSVGNSHIKESTELEFAPVGTEIKAIIDQSSLNNLVSSENNGQVIDFIYHNIEFTGIVNENGKFEIDIPASINEIQYQIIPVSFEYPVKYSAKQYYSDNKTELTDAYGNNILIEKEQIKTFHSSDITIKCRGNNNIVRIEDIVFQSDKIKDENYFGTIY